MHISSRPIYPPTFLVSTFPLPPSKTIQIFRAPITIPHQAPPQPKNTPLFPTIDFLKPHLPQTLKRPARPSLAIRFNLPLRPPTQPKPRPKHSPRLHVLASCRRAATSTLHCQSQTPRRATAPGTDRAVSAAPSLRSTFTHHSSDSTEHCRARTSPKGKSIRLFLSTCNKDSRDRSSPFCI